MENDLKKALEVLKKGGIVLYPTDTIWGMGCDPTDDNAIKKIFRIKGRDESHQMLILVDDAEKISDYADNIPDICYSLIKSEENPLTIIYNNAKNLSPLLTGSDKTIGIRVVKDKFCQELIRHFKKPLVSTSANVTGNPSPVSFSDISMEIQDAVDYIVKWRQDDNRKSLPSTIIKIGNNQEIIKIR